jgi:hypothetical protein
MSFESNQGAAKKNQRGTSKLRGGNVLSVISRGLESAPMQRWGCVTGRGKQLRGYARTKEEALNLFLNYGADSDTFICIDTVLPCVSSDQEATRPGGRDGVA